MATRTRSEPRAVGPLLDPSRERRLDVACAASVAVVAAVLYGVTSSSNPAFGDSSESVAGIESLGVLHAPGYPAYVLVGKLWTLLLPFGDAATQVSLFSLASTVGAVALVFATCRGLGANRLGSVVGALALATSLSVWFYAGYAKAYAFTLLLLAAVLYLLVGWRNSGGTAWLVVAFALLGVATGAAYQVAALSVPGFALLVWSRERRPTAAEFGRALAVGVLVAVAVWSFVLVRAGDDPAVNWGGADSVGRVVDLVRMRDFGFGDKQFGDARVAIGQGAAERVDGGGGPGAGGLFLTPLRLVLYPIGAARQFGPLLILAAVAGGVLAVLRRHRARWALLVILAGNMVGASLVLGGRRVRVTVPEANDVLRYGGFLLAATLVTAVLAGLGAAWALDWAQGRAASTTKQSRADRRRRERQGGAAESRPFALLIAGVAVLGVAHAIALNFTPSNHRMPAFAPDYASNVFASLPDDAVLVIWGAERAFALEEAQSVGGLRPDVDVVRLEQITRPWYREQVAERLDIELGRAGATDFFRGAEDIADELEGERPVFLDNVALFVLSEAGSELGFSQRGLVAEVTDGEGRQDPDLDAMDRLFAKFRVEGLFDDPGRDRVYNDELIVYSSAYLDYGSALANEERYEEAVDAFQRALAVDPQNDAARQNLSTARQRLAEQ